MTDWDLPFVYLASQSPRRAELLRQIGVDFAVVCPIDAVAAEALEGVRPNEAPLDYVQRVTHDKAMAMSAQVAQQFPHAPAPVVCADTCVALDGMILGKPADAAQAHAMLRQLSGRSHEVHTAVGVRWQGAYHAAVVSSTVTFAPLSDDWIDAYVATGESFGKAGAYAIQGLAARAIAHLSGSYSAVMGLPVHELAQLLASCRVALNSAERDMEVTA